jgi:NAD(P)H dehydrogenase (quinone)
MTASAARVAVIHYSATGNVYQLALALAEGAASGGAEVRLRRVEELAPPEAIDNNRRWRHHADVVAPTVAIAELADLEWAEGIALGSPTRIGLPSAQLKQFLDQTGGLWAAGALADKVVTAFTSASTGHGGVESTILAMLNTAYHWGSLVMPVGYTDPSITALGNPYGTSFISRKGSTPDEVELAAARAQGHRLAVIAATLRHGRSVREPG